MSDSFSRRNLFRLGIRDLATAWGQASRESSQKRAKIVPKVRPPGALEDEAAFLDTCTRCHACMQACPFDIIEVLGPLAGRAEGTPFLRIDQNPCHWCGTMDCVHACPSDALFMPDDGKVPALGKALLDENQCLNAEGFACDTCVMFCPSDIQAITMKDPFPEIDQERCVGCGLCIFHCEASPKAITWQPLAEPSEPSQPPTTKDSA